MLLALCDGDGQLSVALSHARLKLIELVTNASELKIEPIVTTICL